MCYLKVTIIPEDPNTNTDSRTTSPAPINGTVKLSSLQRFARDVRTLLRCHQGRLSLSAVESAFSEHFGVALVPASYGYPSVAALLQAVPHVASIRGRGYRKSVLLCQDFQGE